MSEISAKPSISGQPLATRAASPSALYSGVWNWGSLAADMVTGGKPTSWSNFAFHSSW